MPINAATIAGLFPGQGSQSVGMGADFLEHSEQARALFQEADVLLGYSLSELCLKGPLSELTLTQNAQPALLLAGYVSFLEADIPVCATAGHSLGEYTALVAAGVLKFSDAIQLVHKRGRYMQEAVPQGAGGMLAVLGPDEAELQAIIDSLAEGIVEIANLNCPGQIVVAGDSKGIAAYAAALKDKGMKAIPLNVSAPFHCRLMKPAADSLAKDLDATTFSKPRIPVFANVSAAAVTTGDEAKELLKQQVCASVRWTDAMRNLVAQQQTSCIIEFGPGAVLSKLMKRIDPSVERLEVFDRASLEKAKTALQAA